jgi:hypothetical protein
MIGCGEPALGGDQLLLSSRSLPCSLNCDPRLMECLLAPRETPRPTASMTRCAWLVPSTMYG